MKSIILCVTLLHLDIYKMNAKFTPSIIFCVSVYVALLHLDIYQVNVTFGLLPINHCSCSKVRDLFNWHVFCSPFHSRHQFVMRCQNLITILVREIVVVISACHVLCIRGVGAYHHAKGVGNTDYVKKWHIITIGATKILLKNGTLIILFEKFNSAI